AASYPAANGADPLRLRVARRRRDAIDSLTKNTADVSYRTHGSHGGVYSIHPGAAANGVEFVGAQFANIVGHVIPLCLRVSGLLTAPCGGFDKSADVDRFDGIGSHIWSTIYLTLRGRAAE
ncbi:MAG TPA: hypothetical protein VF396_07195, partial [Bradyrhizobium sp.]